MPPPRIGSKGVRLPPQSSLDNITAQHCHTSQPAQLALSESAMKYMFWSVVEISNACGLLMASSAPLMLRHLFTSMMPRGCVLCTGCRQEQPRSWKAARAAATCAQAGRPQRPIQHVELDGQRCEGVRNAAQLNQAPSRHGLRTGPTMSVLNQKILPSLRMNQLQQHCRAHTPLSSSRPKEQVGAAAVTLLSSRAATGR